MLCNIIFHYIILCYIILCFVILYYVIFYYIILCYVILCYVILYFVIFYYIILFCVIVYYVILYSIIWYYIKMMLYGVWMMEWNCLVRCQIRLQKDRAWEGAPVAQAFPRRQTICWCFLIETRQPCFGVVSVAPDFTECDFPLAQGFFGHSGSKWTRLMF